MRIALLKRLALPAGAGIVALSLAGPGWSQVKVEAEVPAADAPASPRAAREAAEEAREEAREATREGREAVREGAREGREAVREGREAVREGRETRREVRRDLRGAREFRVDTLRAPDIGLWVRSSDNGLLVSDLAAEGAIVKLGLKEGDTILSVNGERVTSERQFLDLVFAEDLRHERVEVVVLRDGREQTIYIQPSVFVQEYTTVRTDPLYPYGIIIDDRYDDRVVVLRVLPRSPAFYSGLRAGDAITTFRGQRIRAAADLVRVAADVDAGPLALEVNRGQGTRQIEIDAPEAGAEGSAEARTALRPNLDDPDARVDGEVRPRAKAKADADADAPLEPKPDRPRTEKPADKGADLDTPPARVKPATPATPATPRAKPATPASPATPAAPRATPAAPATPATPATPSSAKPE